MAKRKQDPKDLPNIPTKLPRTRSGTTIINHSEVMEFSRGQSSEADAKFAISVIERQFATNSNMKDEIDLLKSEASQKNSSRQRDLEKHEAWIKEETVQRTYLKSQLSREQEKCKVHEEKAGKLKREVERLEAREKSSLGSRLEIEELKKQNRILQDRIGELEHWKAQIRKMLVGDGGN